MARRNGVTLIVTILHCTPLTEVTYVSKLLDWGFAQDGRVRPIGALVSPVTPAPAQPSPAATARSAQRPPVTAGTITGPSGGLAAASITLIVLAAAAAVILILLRRRAPSRR